MTHLVEIRAESVPDVQTGWYGTLGDTGPRSWQLRVGGLTIWARNQETLAEWLKDAAARVYALPPAPSSDDCKPGDPDPTSATTAEFCPIVMNGSCCTRPMFHVGQHVAGTGRVVVATWCQDGSGYVMATRREARQQTTHTPKESTP